VEVAGVDPITIAHRLRKETLGMERGRRTVTIATASASTRT
jgi:hypothetical protein